MNQLLLDGVKQIESNSGLNSPLSLTFRLSNTLSYQDRQAKKRQKSRSQQNHFVLQQKTITGPLRRKSCYCDECGQLGTFQYKCMNIMGPIPYRKAILTRRASNQHIQSAYPKSAQRMKQSLKKMKTYDDSKIKAMQDVIQEQMTKLRSQYSRQSQLKMYQLTQYTPNCSPKHSKTPRNLPYLSPYVTLRKIDSKLLKPLKSTQLIQQRSQLLTLHRTKYHHKTLSTVCPL
ncbi:unnamed protein product (macronuclear) [Paramecium tetraurelia]|uniref:CCHC-type domain-containing protein n=1 Tax=Paramecium tetraurelia TaxID=5888 RepID=A0BQT3_PARTE|nr:uncharacterized protein GSPATT00031129001 [Paramecium tetraurelia]CAK60900.1 unnamed protein product [Paramecium tetraurelia]|eukprot:XP_001428298.1 hypothetical protein (macronuclear) [Paramecium tetraurelia strain d4-2]